MLSVLPDAVVTNAATSVIINVLANDTGAGLTITSFSNPANGSLVFNDDRTFTYTPMPDFIGDDSFAYTVRDAQGTPANAEVTISVVPNTGAPIATDDVVEVIAGGDGVVIPVLANDMAAGDGALQIVAVSMPGHGVVNVLPDQTIRYVSQAGFTGIDSFNYTVVDEQGNSASATVTVKVLAANRPPLAGDDMFTIEADQPTVLAVLANDSDPDGGPLQVVGFTMPSQGSLVFNPDKTFTYTPAAGYLGDDQFTYTIRDNRGASAVASVTLVIIEVYEAPTAQDDQVTTEVGVPVTIDVLANDTAPAGQEIKIVAVTLPYRGKLVFNPDKTITYTPNAGFVGTDDFTYTIGNGQGSTAKATVTIEVTAGATADTYANGYGYRRRIVLPALAGDQTTVTDTVVLFSETAGWLRTVANGGKVVSPDGADLRFEATDGSKLDHDIERYDSQTGELLAWIRLPSRALSSQIQIIVYYGNPSPVDNEADSAGVWQGYLARWRLPSGSDATAAGRELTADNVTVGELLGGAASFDGTGTLTLADTTWLDGLSALTVQALVKPDAAMIGGSGNILTRKNAAAETGIGLGYLAENGGVANVVYATVGSDAGVASVFSGAARQTIERQLIHARWQSGDAPQLYLNGARTTPSSSQPRSGQTQSIDGPLEIGRDWVGLIDEIRMTDRALPAAWIAAEAHNMLKPRLSYGVGREETVASSTLPIVAVPFAVTGQTGKWIDFDVLARSFVPAGAAATIVGVQQPANGLVTVIDNMVRYAPASDFLGEDQFTYTISNGETQSSAPVVVSVVDPAAHQAELPAGENLLINSKLTGDSTAADAWSNRHPGEGTIVFSATDTDDHRKLRLVATGTGNRAAIEQTYQVTAGKRYVFSVFVAAVGGAPDPDRVIINHAPFPSATVVGGPEARPTIGSVSSGERVYYVFDALVNGPIKFVLGLDGAGDITLERPMLDESSQLRGYAATDPAPVEEPGPDPEPVDFSTAFGTLSAPVDSSLPYQGRYIGGARPIKQNSSNRIGSGSYGNRIIIPYTGTLDVFQINCTSGGPNEGSKSRINNDGQHPIDNTSWPLKMHVQAADANWQPTGPKLREISFDHFRSSRNDGRSRQIHQRSLNGLQVTAGQRMLFWLTNEWAGVNQDQNYVNYNIGSTFAEPAGLNPPRAMSLLYGDSGIFVRNTGNKNGQNMTQVFSDGTNDDAVGAIGLRYTDGREYGNMIHDGGYVDNVFRFYIGSSSRVRQRLRLPNRYYRFQQVWLHAYRNNSGAAALNVRITGPNISPIDLAVPASTFQLGMGSGNPQRMYRIDLPAPFIGTPNSTYQIELSSPSSSGAHYTTHCNRRFLHPMDPSSATGIGQLDLPGTANASNQDQDTEYSLNGGSSWQRGGYSGNGMLFAAWGLFSNGHVATTLEGLP